MRAFSLVEIAIVIGMLAFISTIGVVAGIGSYRDAQFTTDRDTFRTALMRARMEAVSGICAGSGCPVPVAHGVSVTSSGYTVFAGETYATRDGSEDEALESVHLRKEIIGREVTFEPLSATVLAPASVVFRSAAGHVSTTSVNSEGAISETP